MPVKVASYSAVRLGPWARLQELASLYRSKRHQAGAAVARRLAQLDRVDADIAALRGAPLRDSRVLIIGPGQHWIELLYWARRGNHVVGIDLDPTPSRPSIATYARMWRHSGSVRVAKTLGRRVLGIDAAYRREVQRQLPEAGTGRFELRAMDAADLAFDDATFDFAYSRSVFEHLSDPVGAMRELARVLRPGGAAYMAVHLYTSDGGCHDARLFAGQRDELPLWAHLRPGYAERVRPNAYLNRLSLDAWREAFAQQWPGVDLTLHGESRERLEPELNAIRAGGELAGYADEELLNDAVVATWRRPARLEVDERADGAARAG